MTTKYLVLNGAMLLDNMLGDIDVYATATTLLEAQECAKELVDNGSVEWGELIIIPFSKYYEAKPVDPEWAIKTVK